MLRPRIIPCLLLRDGGLVKTRRFKNPVYVGDPINAVKLFNDKEVDELVLLDITATLSGRPPFLDALREIASEAFMPLCYGGGLTTRQQAEQLFSAGFEKVSINSAAVTHPHLIRELAADFGRQSIVGGIDVKKNWLGRPRVVTRCGKQATGHDPVAWARYLESEGVGEIFLNSVDRDGCQQGYDLELVKAVSEAVSVPVIACGGAGQKGHLAEVLNAGAAAAAAGSLFVFSGPHRAVLISYPRAGEIEALSGASIY